ncbi:glycosyltransferase family 39 protein, partial [Candidatus Fermentibacteria bacterium]|nr:glycosyltransferase family 39 protein [Candidatus Fermentibacteria bacterium]
MTVERSWLHVRWLAALLLLAIPPLFLNLGSLPIRLWDESRQAVSALEMLDGSNPLVPTYLGKPDLWNTKPPLLVWLQATSLTVFGLNEFAIRLPSAVAALATVVLLFVFCARALGKPRLGLLAGLVLVSSRGYVGRHVARTGDYDALLTLWTTSYAFAFFLFIEAAVSQRRLWYLVAASVCMALAVLTKSSSGLLIMPGLFIYALLRRRVATLVRHRGFFPCLAVFLLLTIGYYVLREHHNPGYLSAVLKNDVGGRFFSTIEQHQGPFDFYYARLRDTRFSPWLYFLPLGLCAGLLSAGSGLRRLSLHLSLVVLAFLLVISAGQTKLEWYDAPIYPLAAIIVAVGLETIMALVLRSGTNRGRT